MKLLCISILLILGFSCNTSKETATRSNPYYEGLFVHEQDMELLTKMNHGKILGTPNVTMIKLINDKEAIMVYEIVDKAHFNESVRYIHTKLINDKEYIAAQRKLEWITDLTYTYTPQRNDSIVFVEKTNEYALQYSGKIINNCVGLAFRITLADSIKNKLFTPSAAKDVPVEKYVFYPVVSE